MRISGSQQLCVAVLFDNQRLLDFILLARRSTDGYGDGDSDDVIVARMVWI